MKSYTWAIVGDQWLCGNLTSSSSTGTYNVKQNKLYSKI